MKWRPACLFVAALLAMATGCAARPSSVSEPEWSFCTDARSGGGVGAVLRFTEVYVPGLPPPSDSVADSVKLDPRFAAACQIAFELAGLSQEQWDWCFDERNRANFLAPAVVLLGMGEEEARGKERFSEAPGDTVAEYTQACRFAFGRWRDAGIGEVDAATDPFFRMTDAQSSWCEDDTNRPTLEWTARTLGIETAMDAPEIHQLHAFARACRLAFLLPAGASSDEPFRHVRDGGDVFGQAAAAHAQRRLATVAERTEPRLCVAVAITDAVKEAEFTRAGCDLWFQLFAFEGPPDSWCCTWGGPTQELKALTEAAEPIVELFRQREFEAGLALWLDIVEREARDFVGERPRRIP